MAGAGQNSAGEPRPATVTDFRPWHKRHPASWTAIKAAIGLAVGAAGAFIIWFGIDLRDNVRDNTAAAAEHAEIHERVETVETAAASERQSIRGRVRAVERTTAQHVVALKWIIQSLERLERAAGTARHAPPAPVLGPPEPAP